MKPADIVLWIMRHVLGREPGDRADLQHTRRAITRAHQVADRWNEHVRDSWRPLDHQQGSPRVQ